MQYQSLPWEKWSVFKLKDGDSLQKGDAAEGKVKPPLGPQE